MDRPGTSLLDALSGPDGQGLLARLAGVELTAADELRLAEVLRREYPAELVTAALAQHELRGRARAKFTRAEAMWLTRDGLEQATAEPVAVHRSGRYAGRARVADLCCGIGGDLVALAAAPGVTEVLGVDRDPLHLRMAALNAGVYGVSRSVRTALADVREADLAGVDAVFVDPTRRAGGLDPTRRAGGPARRAGGPGGSRRLRTGDSEPPLSWCTALTAAVPAVGVKAAPGLDRARVPPGWEVEFVADGRELKEAVLWSPAFAAVASRATVLPTGDQLLPEPGDLVRCASPGEFLLDPSPAVTRAGLVEDLARGLGAWKIDPMIAFLSADAPLWTPFGRSLRVLDSGPWREKELVGRLRGHDIGSVDIRRRGLAGDVEAIARRLRPALVHGSRPATLVMTRVHDEPWALICVDT